MNKCTKEEFNGACCCSCKWHIEDYHHCTTSPELRRKLDKCVCSTHKGWICMPPEMNAAYSGWTEHGMCEMHEFKYLPSGISMSDIGLF